MQAKICHFGVVCFFARISDLICLISFSFGLFACLLSLCVDFEEQMPIFQGEMMKNTFFVIFENPTFNCQILWKKDRAARQSKDTDQNRKCEKIRGAWLNGGFQRSAQKTPASALPIRAGHTLKAEILEKKSRISSWVAQELFGYFVQSILSTVQFFHDIFHGCIHKCSERFMSKRLSDYTSLNTSLMEQVNITPFRCT